MDGTAERKPCSLCGSETHQYFAGQVEHAAASDHLKIALLPANQTRDWRQRWEALKREANSLNMRMMTPCSAESIASERQRLQSFFIQCYALKDILIMEAPNAVSASTVENAVTTDPNLALIADLANLDKHGRLTRKMKGSASPARSGTIPTYGRVSGDSHSGSSGWRLSLEIIHGQQKLDGVELAQRGIAAWQRFFTSLGIQ
jgi:hypothetical protein